MTTRTASARYDGFGKSGRGHITTQSDVMDETRYGFDTRFGDEKGTNPEELIAAAHASCFTMALSFALAGAGYEADTLETTAKVTLDKEDDGFKVSRSDLTLAAKVRGIEADEFDRLAADAKVNRSISKLMNADFTLTHTLN